MAGFTPVTFGGENVTPKNDGGLYQAHNSDGILLGCAMSLTGSPVTDLTIASGEFIQGGRVILVDGATNIDLTGIGISDGFARVVMTINLSNTPPIAISIDESASISGFSGLNQEDININGNEYQMVLAILKVVGGVVTDFYSQLGYSGLVNEGNLVFTRGGTEAGRVSVSQAGGIMNVAKISGGSAVSGMYSDTTDSTIIYGGSDIYVRPNGQSSSTGQVRFDTSGNITAYASGSSTGTMSAGSNVFKVGKTDSGGNFTYGMEVDSQDSIIIGGGGGNGIYLRPNGINDATGQVRLDASGNLSVPSISDVAGLTSTDDIIIKGANNTRAVNFLANNTQSGTVKYEGGSGTFACAKTDSGGSVQAGLTANTKTTVAANSDEIRFRPNGFSSTSGQVIIDTSGRISGASRLESNSAGIDTNTNTKLYGNGANIYIRPNGISSASGQVRIDTSGSITSYDSNSTSRGILSAGANVFEAGKTDSSGNFTYGMRVDSSNSAILGGSSGVYLRPNGPSSSTGQATIATDGSISASGQITGGHPLTTKAPGGSVSLTASMGTITSVTAGIEVAGVYLVTAECDYTPGTATAHYPQLEIQNGIKNTYYTATAGGRHFCLSGLVTGMSSIVFRGTTGTNSTGATASNITVNVVRIN